MELTCLNCLGTFEMDDKGVPAPSGRVQCPICGADQTFVTLDEARLKRPQPPVPPPRSSKTTTAFRKPMQAFVGGSPRPSTPPSLQPAPVAGEAPVVVTPFEPAAPTPPEAFLPPMAPDAPADESGSWMVRSPTGLVLEFPASELLVNWSAVVDNPAPYQVSRGGQEWTSLAEFLQLVRQGNRSTSAFRVATRGSPSPAAPREFVPASPATPAPGSSPTVPTPRPAGVTAHPTSSFQIKLKEPAAPRWRRWVLLGFGLFAIIGGAAVAATLLDLW